MNKPQESLASRINEGKPPTDEETVSLMELLCVSCKTNTIAAIRRTLTRIPRIPYCGIYSRVMLSPVGYRTWKSYPDEISKVRKLLKKAGR